MNWYLWCLVLGTHFFVQWVLLCLTCVILFNMIHLGPHWIACFQKWLWSHHTFLRPEEFIEMYNRSICPVCIFSAKAIFKKFCSFIFWHTLKKVSLRKFSKGDYESSYLIGFIHTDHWKLSFYEISEFENFLWCPNDFDFGRPNGRTIKYFKSN